MMELIISRLTGWRWLLLTMNLSWRRRSCLWRCLKKCLKNSSACMSYLQTWWINSCRPSNPKTSRCHSNLNNSTSQAPNRNSKTKANWSWKRGKVSFPLTSRTSQATRTLSNKSRKLFNEKGLVPEELSLTSKHSWLRGWCRSTMSLRRGTLMATSLRLGTLSPTWPTATTICVKFCNELSKQETKGQLCSSSWTMLKRRSGKSMSKSWALKMTSKRFSRWTLQAPRLSESSSRIKSSSFRRSSAGRNKQA